MRRAGLMIVLTALMAAPSASLAEPERSYSPRYQACLDAPSGQNTVGMLDCIAAELRVQDKYLNEAYKADMAGLADNPAGKAALLKAQRAWIAYRDADCAAVGATSGGTIAAILVQTCFLEHTAERAQRLEALLEP